MIIQKAIRLHRAALVRISRDPANFSDKRRQAHWAALDAYEQAHAEQNTPEQDESIAQGNFAAARKAEVDKWPGAADYYRFAGLAFHHAARRA